MKNLGIMGGAFNPIHSRHLMVAQAACDQLALDAIVFVPSGQPPHKKNLLDKEERYAMVLAAIADNPKFEASRLEVDAPGTSWTIDTFKAIIADYAARKEAVKLHFIVGEDNLPVLRDYDRRGEFLSLCRLVVSPRATADKSLARVWQPQMPEADLAVLDCPANEVSSTIIRDWVKAGRSIKYLVHDKVDEMIKARGHYR